jgi:hypothetical protein
MQRFLQRDEVTGHVCFEKGMSGQSSHYRLD